MISYDAHKDIYHIGNYSITNKTVCHNDDILYKCHQNDTLKNALYLIKNHTDDLKIIGEINLFLRGL